MSHPCLESSRSNVIVPCRSDSLKNGANRGEGKDRSTGNSWPYGMSVSSISKAIRMVLSALSHPLRLCRAVPPNNQVRQREREAWQSRFMGDANAACTGCFPVVRCGWLGEGTAPRLPPCCIFDQCPQHPLRPAHIPERLHVRLKEGVVTPRDAVTGSENTLLRFLHQRRTIR